MKSLLIVIPAHNEEKIIKSNIKKTLSFLKKANLPVKWKIIVAENGSSDKTITELKKIPKSNNFSYISLPVRSRSKALIHSWLNYNANYYMFMDADLSTDITHIPTLVQYLEQGYDIVIGSRKLSKSQVKRLFIRSFLSSGFHLLITILFGLKISDYQCGFKAITKDVRNKIIPQMKYTNEGLLDTEMLIVSKNKGYKIKEIPIKWYDTRPSKFNIHRAIYMNLFNAYRIKKDLVLGRYN